MAERPKTPNKFTFGEIETLFFEFEKLLLSRSKIVPAGSKLERAGLAAIQMLATHKKEMIHNYKEDYRNEWRRVLSMADILRKIISMQKCPGFNSIWPHILLLLGNGEIAQNLWSEKEDSHANYVFELYAGLLALPLCTAMELEPPKKSANGQNPDVIATIEGVRWGIACKAMHSRSTKSLLDRVRDGIKQIDQCEKAQNGMVMVSLKNVIPHDSVWPVIRAPHTGDLIYLTASNDEIALQILKAECKRYEVELLELLGGREGFRAEFRGSKVEPLILAHLCIATSILRDKKPTFTLIKMLVAITVDDPLPERARRLAVALNEVLHDRYLDPEGMAADLSESG
jgi:hypothetical protein